MKSTANIGLGDVQAVYSGPEGQLWELVMGQQIHIGGFRSSMELAEKAGIGPGMSGRRSLLLQRGGDAVPGPLPQRGADARRRCHRDRRRARTPPLRGRGACRPDRLHAGRRLRDGPARGQRRFRLGRRRLVLRDRQEAADGRGRPAAEAARHHCLHRLGRGPDGFDRRRVGPLSEVHEVPQHARHRRLCRAAGRSRAARCWRRKIPAGSRPTWTCISTC